MKLTKLNMADGMESTIDEHPTPSVDTQSNHVSDKSNTDAGSKSTESGDVQDIESIKKQATQMLLLGKRNILIHDFQTAVEELAQSCKLFRTIYDEKAVEMGDPYFFYGKALFELARNESEVLGEPMQESKDDDDNDDEECEEEEEAGTGEGDKNTEVNNGKEAEEHQAENSGENENTTEETEEVNDLQLSWEFLELAKLIYQQTADTCKETATKLAEVYLLLGENSLESENYEIAIQDMKKALELQQQVLPEEDRRIAETYYHLGVAHSLFAKFDEAIEFFKSAITQLEKKIQSLEARKKAGDKKTEEEEKDAFYTMDGEIESIRSIIKDIEDKISDMKDYKNQIKEEALNQVLSGSTKPG
ncbi:UNVERIFIED_CONTAM: hypothetical protein PYX00_000356 [Menopon gallinae]|uniref:Tetratricopeptide SHNi-TPR domain-containing protein n=1 Tax=Menopon gallinae TaxID=328185 RepID=A0AAW2IA11_9NEOP